MLFQDFSGAHKMELRPLSWAGGAWEFVDGAGANWDNNGGTCGFLFGNTYAIALACHATQPLVATFIVTDSGFVTSPYTHFIDDVKIGTTTFSDCTLDAALANFRNKRRGSEINVGPDLREGPPPTGHVQANNFTGTALAAGDTWITVYDETPANDTIKNIFTGSVSLSADVLIAKQNNAKGAGLLALYNQSPPAVAKGLALFLIEAGNTDRLVLATVTGAPSPPGGPSAPTTLMTKTLAPGQILINKWYRVTMDVAVTGANFSVTGAVFNHDDPLDPNSAVTTQVDGSLIFPSTTLASKGLAGSGEVGIAATATNAVVNSSVTNFEITP
jgi:hypothetical protein